MPTIKESRATLRSRFLLAKALRTLWELQQEVGLTSQTMKAFVLGRPVTTTTLEAIEAWVETQETQESLDATVTSP